MSSDTHSSSRKGRIAQVLAQARAAATLKEPSRPVTPASLDARLDYIPEYGGGFRVKGSTGNASKHRNVLKMVTATDDSDENL